MIECRLNSGTAELDSATEKSFWVKDSVVHSKFYSTVLVHYSGLYVLPSNILHVNVLVARTFCGWSFMEFACTARNMLESGRSGHFASVSYLQNTGTEVKSSLEKPYIRSRGAEFMRLSHHKQIGIAILLLTIS